VTPSRQAFHPKFCTYFSSPPYTTIIFEEYELCSSSLCSFPVTSSLLGLNTLPSSTSTKNFKSETLKARWNNYKFSWCAIIFGWALISYRNADVLAKRRFRYKMVSLKMFPFISGNLARTSVSFFSVRHSPSLFQMTSTVGFLLVLPSSSEGWNWIGLAGEPDVCEAWFTGACLLCRRSAELKALSTDARNINHRYLVWNMSH
jgi:hypothetical protein